MVQLLLLNTIQPVAGIILGGFGTGYATRAQHNVVEVNLETV
jgi:hypothetical protein